MKVGLWGRDYRSVLSYCIGCRCDSASEEDALRYVPSASPDVSLRGLRNGTPRRPGSVEPRHCWSACFLLSVNAATCSVALWTRCPLPFTFLLIAPFVCFLFHSRQPAFTGTENWWKDDWTFYVRKGDRCYDDCDWILAAFAATQRR